MLYDWRVDGVGQQEVKFGRSPRYPESCVRAWIEEELHGWAAQPLGTFGDVVVRRTSRG